MPPNLATPTTLPARSPDDRVGLLVSVRDAQEGADALAAGVNVIDVKEPAAGPLGPPTGETLADVLARVAGRAPVTAALGELHEADPAGVPAGLAAVKCGLAGSAGSDWQQQLFSLGKRLPRGTRLVPAAYADYAEAGAPTPEEVLAFAGRLGSGWLVLDTWDKTGGDSLSLLTPDRIGRLVGEAETLGVSVVLAGRLSADHIREAAALGPALIGVRGAACDGGRGGHVSTDRLRALVGRVTPANRCEKYP